MAKLKVKKPRQQSAMPHSTRNGMGRRISGFATTKMQTSDHKQGLGRIVSGRGIKQISVAL